MSIQQIFESCVIDASSANFKNCRGASLSQNTMYSEAGNSDISKVVHVQCAQVSPARILVLLGKPSEAYTSQAYRWAVKYFALLYGTPLPAGTLTCFSAKSEIAKITY